jgi:general secretion pathway protein G
MNNSRNSLRKRRAKSSGFTLIEVMVVVLILAILAAVVAPKLLSKPEEARIAKAKTDIQSIETSLDLYRLDNFQYPSTGEGIEALLTRPADASNNWKQYLKRLPTDPWGNAYKYTNPGTHGDIDIYSLGPDRVESDDDIGNWDLN